METRVEFEADPSGVPSARRFVDATLRGWGLPELTYAATLLTSELVTNAVLHARTAIRVEMRYADGALRVEVCDGSDALPVPRHHSVHSTTGRGLLLVSQLAAQWGTYRFDDPGSGKAVWFELTADADADAEDTGLEAAYGDAEDWLAEVCAL